MGSSISNSVGVDSSCLLCGKSICAYNNNIECKRCKSILHKWCLIRYRNTFTDEFTKNTYFECPQCKRTGVL